VIDKDSILPIFSTQGNICRSLLTADDETEILENSPVSIFAIAKKHSLDKLFVIDRSFLEFPKLYKNCNKYNIQLIFGISFLICNNSKNKNEESLFSNCRVAVVMKNSDGYVDLIKLNNRINANKESFYYESRGDWNDINELVTDNLQVFIEPYNNFLEKNFIFNGSCVPDFGKIKPIMTYASMDILYDQILIPKIKEYSKSSGFELCQVWPTYYYTPNDFKAYSVLRSIDTRNKFNCPNIPFLSSNMFNYIDYLKYSNGIVT
jgi:DNA polymerase III alpha subunit